MFPFREIERQYKYQTGEETIFKRLNKLTYNHSDVPLEGNFTVSDPPTFELYHPNELLRNKKPFATKVTVVIQRQSGQQLVSARTSTNPTYWILLAFLIISFVVQIFRTVSFTLVIGYLLVLVAVMLWDRYIKRKTLKRLEKVLP